MGWAKHVGAEDEPLSVGRERHVRLQFVIVLAHIDQTFGVKETWLDKIFGVRVFDPRKLNGPCSTLAAKSALSCRLSRIFCFSTA